MTTTRTTTIDPALRHGGTFSVICDPAWPLTGIWPDIDALATEHRAAVEAFKEAVDAAPRKPSLAEYDRACREAIANGHDLPEPPVSPTDDEVAAGDVRVRAAGDRVMTTATTILNTVRDNRDAMADADTIRGPIREAEDRIRELLAEVDALQREKAKYERIPMWLNFNARTPWTDPTPEAYPDPAEATFAKRLRNATG